MKLANPSNHFVEADFITSTWHRFDFGINITTFGFLLFKLPPEGFGYQRCRLYPMFGRSDAGNITFWKGDTKIKIYSLVIHSLKKKFENVKNN
jgi:hypothetical protein